MKYLFIFILSVLSINLFAKNNLEKFLSEYHLKDLNLTQGISLSEQDITDFSNIKAQKSQIKLYSDNSFVDLYNIGSYWYSTDFTEDPFDGRIELAVVGEPLPSSIVTLVISGMLGFLSMLKKKINFYIIGLEYRLRNFGSNKLGEAIEDPEDEEDEYDPDFESTFVTDKDFDN